MHLVFRDPLAPVTPLVTIMTHLIFNAFPGEHPKTASSKKRLSRTHYQRARAILYDLFKTHERIWLPGTHVEVYVAVTRMYERVQASRGRTSA